MKKGLIMLAAFIIFILSYKEGSLIPQSREIDELEFVRAVALDKGMNNQMRVSVLLKKEKQSSSSAGGGDSGGGDDGESEIITGEGNTAFSTQSFFESYSDKSLFYGHAEYILIGEDAAKEDMRKYTDFVTRDHEYRLTAHVYITKGKAEDILTSSKTFLPDKLRILYKNIKELSISDELPLIELVSKLEDNQLYAIAVPMVKTYEEASMEDQNKNQQSSQGGQQSGGQGAGAAVQKTKEIALGGFAIIKDFHLIGFLDDTLARAYCFATNRVGSGSIDVLDQTGNYVGLEVLQSGTQIIPRVEDGKLTGVTIKTVFQTNVDEIHSTENIFQEERIKYIESEQSDVIKKEIESLIRFAQENKADFMGIGQAISMAHPIIWKDYESNWPEFFSTLDIGVQVESKVARSYNINEPIGNKEY